MGLVADECCAPLLELVEVGEKSQGQLEARQRHELGSNLSAGQLSLAPHNQAQRTGHIGFVWTPLCLPRVTREKHVSLQAEHIAVTYARTIIAFRTDVP